MTERGELLLKAEWPATEAWLGAAGYGVALLAAIGAMAWFLRHRAAAAVRRPQAVMESEGGRANPH
jgi:hypothetical protein